MALKIVCIGFFALLLLDISACRPHGSRLRRRSRSTGDSPTDSVNISNACSLKTKKLWTANINWTRLNGTGLSGVNTVNVVNRSFFIEYCSGLCDPHPTQHNLQPIKNKYAQQMSGLVTDCEDNEVDCMELMPCCMPKRYHGGSKPTRIEFKTKTIRVKYVNELNYEEYYYHTFLEPRDCHCQ